MDQRKTELCFTALSCHTNWLFLYSQNNIIVGEWMNDNKYDL